MLGGPEEKASEPLGALEPQPRLSTQTPVGFRQSDELARNDGSRHAAAVSPIRMVRVPRMADASISPNSPDIRGYGTARKIRGPSLRVTAWPHPPSSSRRSSALSQEANQQGRGRRALDDNYKQVYSMPVRWKPLSLILRAGILLAFLASAHAQPLRSPVLAAIAASSEAPARSLFDLIKALDADGKTRALIGLDRLDRAVLDTAALAELSEAYRLLGRPEAALKAAQVLSVRDASSPTGDAQSILSLAQAGNYAAAQAAAESGLKRFPGDKNLLALFHQVKGRTVGTASSEPIFSARISAPSSLVSVVDKRPYILPNAKGKGAPPPSPTAHEAYLAPGAAKASALSLFKDGFLARIMYKVDAESSAEKQRMADLKRKLGETETGRGLISDLGGWEQIDRDVDIRFAGVWSRNLTAYFRPFDTPDSKGHRGAVVLRTELLNEPDAVAVPTLAHELSHVRDFRGEPGLAIPSEFAAHRTQVQVFEEIKTKMTSSEIAQLRNSPRGRYQTFIALLWEDHLVQRFKTPKEMAAAVGSVQMFENRAAEVLGDLNSGGVGPGGPQLDHHLNGLKGGLYRNLTDEKDIVDLIAEREASGNYDAGQRRMDEEMLVRRKALLAQSDKRDAEFRTRHGFIIEAGK
jgi:hypothetical protein